MRLARPWLPHTPGKKGKKKGAQRRLKKGEKKGKEGRGEKIAYGLPQILFQSAQGGGKRNRRDPSLDEGGGEQR